MNNEADPVDVQLLLHSLTALRKSDFSVRLPLEWHGVAGEVADAFNGPRGAA